MYGKVFEQMFTGSMVGAGPDVFAVWTYAIVHARPPGEVELNPRLLSVMLGMTIEDVERTIEKLCSPDPYSRTPDHDGTRMIRQGQFAYFLPNWQKYRDIRNNEERLEKAREYRRRYRAASKSSRQDLSEVEVDNFVQYENVRNGHASESASAVADAGEEREPEREEPPKKPKKPKPSVDMALFERFWEAYQKKVGKVQASRVWVSKIGADTDLAERVIAAAQQFADLPDTKKDARKWQPHPSTWLHGEKWNDEIPGVTPVKSGPPKMDDDLYADAVQEYLSANAETRAEIRNGHAASLDHANLRDFDRQWIETFLEFVSEIDREEGR